MPRSYGGKEETLEEGMLRFFLRAGRAPSARRDLPVLASGCVLFDRLLSLDRLWELHDKVKASSGPRLFDALLKELRIDWQVRREDLEALPARGPLVVAANHPFGMLEGIVLGALLSQVRPDVKILANRLLAGVPELAESLILVDPYASRQSVPSNSRGLWEAVRWLRSGGALATFPAGEVSHWDLRARAPVDPPWSPTIARLARITGATMAPVYFQGCNSLQFYLLSLLHPAMRLARLPEELLNKAGTCVEVRIGSPIPNHRIAEMDCDEEAIRHLRWRTYLLGSRVSRPAPVRDGRRGNPPAPPPRFDLSAEVSALPETQRLHESEGYLVFEAEASQIPGLLREIGRLREVAFRHVGEGTGRELDLDEFDAYYRHLVLWHSLRREVVGAYRVGRTQPILAARGSAGLYTSTLFAYDPRFFQMLGPALELGRSFVRLEYQKHYLPLLLLWKGLARVVARDPATAVLFGAVSISSEYSTVSRRLLAQFLLTRQPHELRRFVKPRQPFPIRQRDRWLVKSCRDLEALSAAIGDIEADRKGVPILLKQYSKLGGKVVQFSVDSEFSGCLDALIVVNLRETAPDLLARFMGRQAATRFLRAHRQQAVAS